MTEFFLKIVNMSISASWIVLAVLLLRLLLKKAPKWINVILWGIVGLRLVMPFTLESVFSLIPSAETVNPEIMMDKTPQINTGVPIINNAINPVISESFTPAPMDSANPLQIWIPIFALVWVIGIVAMVLYTVISYLRVKRKIGTAVKFCDNIYQSESVVSPFVLGILRPKIYLPFNMNEQDMAQVIAHENAHISRKDHLWKPLGFLILTLHWFNPLMWLGYVLLCRDIELACDEKVVKTLNNEQKADYSQALLACSVNRRIIAACPLAFGEVGVKKRIKSVLNYKKPAFWLVLTAIVLSVVVAVCFLTNPRTTLNDELSVFVDMQIADHNYSKGNTDDNFIVVNSKILEVDKSADKTIVYLWAMYHEYSCENGIIKLEAASHVPTVITAKREGKHGHYKLVEYWEPHDGELFESDIKGKFPVHLHAKALNSQLYDDEQRAFCENAAKEYYSVSQIGGADSINVQTFESTVSYANWSDDSKIYMQALNTDKISINSVQHLPIYKFDTLNDLEQFKKNFGSILTMNHGYDEVPSFNSATQKYDNAFFEENSLLLVYVSASNCTHRFKMQNVGYDNKSFSVHVVETTNAEYVDTAMAGWFITVAVSDNLIKTVTNFDADLNNVDTDDSVKLSVNALKKIYPEFFGVSTDGGLTVYVWQTDAKTYKCHLANTSMEAISDNSFAYTVKDSATIEEMKVILSSYDIDKSEITIQPVNNPLSSYYCEITDSYRAKVKAMFWGDIDSTKEETDEPSNLPEFETTVSYANWSDNGEINSGALNSGKLVIGKVRHLPIRKFDKLEDLEEFKNTFSGELTMEQGYNNVPSFNSVTAKYDKKFFKENSLLLVYVAASNASYRFKMQSVDYNDKSLCVHVVETTKPEVVITAMSGWFITVAVPDKLIKNVTNFDADLDNVESNDSVVKKNIKHGSSIYTDDEIESAIKVIKTDFKKDWKGCTLKKIAYLGDERLKDYREFADRNNYTDVLVLTSDFYVAPTGADGSLNADSSYRDFKWILVRNKGEAWKHVDHGYP